MEGKKHGDGTLTNEKGQRRNGVWEKGIRLRWDNGDLGSQFTGIERLSGYSDVNSFTLGH